MAFHGWKMFVLKSGVQRSKALDGACKMAQRKFMATTSRGLSQSWKKAYINELDVFSDSSSLDWSVPKSLDFYTAQWMNRADVKKALHVEDAPVKSWPGPTDGWQYTSNYNACNKAPGQPSMIDFYRKIAPKMTTTIVFNGDTDPCVSYEGTRTAIERVGFEILPGGGIAAFFGSKGFTLRNPRIQWFDTFWIILIWLGDVWWMFGERDEIGWVKKTTRFLRFQVTTAHGSTTSPQQRWKRWWKSRTSSVPTWSCALLVLNSVAMWWTMATVCHLPRCMGVDIWFPSSDPNQLRGCWIDFSAVVFLLLCCPAMQNWLKWTMTPSTSSWTAGRTKLEVKYRQDRRPSLSCSCESGERCEPQRSATDAVMFGRKKNLSIASTWWLIPLRSLSKWVITPVINGDQWDKYCLQIFPRSLNRFLRGPAARAEKLWVSKVFRISHVGLGCANGQK